MRDVHACGTLERTQHVQKCLKIFEEKAKFALRTAEISARFRVFTCIRSQLVAGLDLITIGKKDESCVSP